MKFKSFYLLALLIFATTACTAQIEIVGTQKGNTGHRGIIPRDENGNHMPMPQGRDYYSLELKAKRACTVEIISLTVKADDGQTITLTPVFTEGAKKAKLTADKIGYLRAERDESVTTSKLTLKGEGLLKFKINGKVRTLPIENFTLVLPQ
ncbi:MAG: hypothetical protein U5L45_24135 [Saprospiraceae bacterium]|nr:hypothetical protein [Saprospiraceae bacterium]